MNTELRIKLLQIALVPLFMILNSLFFINPAYAVEQGVQIPSSNELSGLSSTPFKYQWIKFQYVWGSDQPIDTWVKSAKQAGFKVLVSVAKKPTSVPKGESGYQQYGTFMQELAFNLGNNVDAYEIWNEPNLNDEWAVWGAIDPKEYVKLLKYGAEGVKNGNPNTQVVTAALAPLSGHYDDEKFFNEFVAAGGLKIPEVDGIGWHSNVTANIPPSDTGLQGFQRVKIALNQGKPVWITEFGWDRTTANINLATQLQYITEAFKVGDQLQDVQTMIIWNYGFGKLNPDFVGWDISLDTQTIRQSDGQINETADSGCKGLLPEECALKLTNIATVPENISKSITLEKPLPASTLETFFNKIAGFLGFNLNNPQTYAGRSNVQVKTAIPETAQSTVIDRSIKTSENIGYNPSKTDDEKEVLGVDTLIQQGVGIYQFMLPKEVQDSYIDGESISYTCGYENSQYPTGIRPINGTKSQADCNKALGIK